MIAYRNEVGPFWEDRRRHHLDNANAEIRRLQSKLEHAEEHASQFREALIRCREAMRPFATVAEQIPASAPDHLTYFHSQLTAGDWRKLLQES